MLVFGGLGLVVVVLGVVLALFVIKPLMTGTGDEGGRSDSAQAKQSGSEKAKKKDHGHGASLTYAIKDIVINPAGTGGSRFLSVSFGFEMSSPELASEFESREHLVRDALITILSSKTVSQLTDAKQKEIMRYQIKKRLSKLFATEELDAVYYTDFVLQ
jgi:flagellar FliL protein